MGTSDVNKTDVELAEQATQAFKDRVSYLVTARDAMWQADRMKLANTLNTRLFRLLGQNLTDSTAEGSDNG